MIILFFVCAVRLTASLLALTLKSTPSNMPFFQAFFNEALRLRLVALLHVLELAHFREQNVPSLRWGVPHFGHSFELELVVMSYLSGSNVGEPPGI